MWCLEGRSAELVDIRLFSSVVTGFAVESYQELQPDPNADLVQLLARIAARVGALTNSSTLSISPNGIGNPASFSPPSSSIQINIFWFSSLILSLTTVIIGIVSLQWLREHQRYTEPLTSKQALAIFHLRAASLKKWHVPHIFSFLPLLLQAAVILFFAGLVEFLLSLNRMVVIPAILLMGLSILFLIATTILPTLQLLAANIFVLSNGSLPSQCAYKSPQSWIFRRIFLIGTHIPVLETFAMASPSYHCL
ncbi:hypothetical protein HYPSUDRAFT_744124 [Hypholoma sublateritium FD-334 SS-4]|uniref:DUF6535 domain-containing protein n=1 Tax=Hypholoma sublateritium (strain FD-334 SS-4) TaxID=945553 RepID=A0A0D2NRF1_HYPSF|nr:hypothetical protein HYPSUDRAFT_744124 [Hypholoma sublateritium FD-334 SS-4]